MKTAWLDYERDRARWKRELEHDRHIMRCMDWVIIAGAIVALVLVLSCYAPNAPQRAAIHGAMDLGPWIPSKEVKKMNTSALRAIIKHDKWTDEHGVVYELTGDQKGYIASRTTGADHDSYSSSYYMDCLAWLINAIDPGVLLSVDLVLRRENGLDNYISDCHFCGDGAHGTETKWAGCEHFVTTVLLPDNSGRVNEWAVYAAYTDDIATCDRCDRYTLEKLDTCVHCREYRMS